MTLAVRHHVAGDTRSEAVYSRCGRYRYALTRVWDGRGARIAWVMLNPSTATEVRNDPTIERCERRARALGYGAMRIVNLFALRETRPARLKRAPDPVGADNDSALAEAAQWADDVLCAWGVHGAHLGRGAAVARLLVRGHARLLALGETKDGHPRHPLYVGYAVAPRPWSPPQDRAGPAPRR